MKLGMSERRPSDRRGLLNSLDQLREDIDVSGLMEGTDHFRLQAHDTILGGAAEAFDLSREPESIVQAYDTAPLLPPDRISRKWKN